MIPPNPEPLDLPTINRYLRLLSYQALARPESFGGPVGGAPGSWYPGFCVKKVTDERNLTRVRLVRCTTSSEVAAVKAAEQAEWRSALVAAAGFGAVWEAMCDCGRPGVGHNCMFDVAYSVSQFGEGRLPATWEGFKRATANWFKSGLYDTKHICRQLPDVVGTDTTLAVMYGSLVPQPGGIAPEAAAASSTSTPPLAPAPASGLLPARVSVSHCRGFEKYVAVAAGQCAHEAGYDAFMTGSVFAALETLMAPPAGKTAPAASDDTDAVGATGNNGAGGTDSNAAGAAGTAAGVAAALAAAAAEVEVVAGGDAAMRDATPAVAPVRPSPYASVEPYKWRLNVTRSDLPYALLRPSVPGDPTSQEPIPERPLVFHLGPLSYGVRANDIHRACEEAGLGKVRITFLPGNNALVELETEAAATRVRQEGALQARGLCAEVLPYAQYRARKDEMLAAGTWPLFGHGGGPRGGGGANVRPGAPPGAAGAAPSAAAASPIAGTPARAAKRPRVEEEEEQRDEGGPTPGRQCVLM